MNGIALLTANPSDRIALRGVRVIARVAGMSQKTTLEQTFVNLENRAIEAVYTFPPSGRRCDLRLRSRHRRPCAHRDDRRARESDRKV